MPAPPLMPLKATIRDSSALKVAFRDFLVRSRGVGDALKVAFRARQATGSRRMTMAFETGVFEVSATESSATSLFASGK